MRAAAILGRGCSPRDLKTFQTEDAVEWRVGLPAANPQADAILLFGGDGTVHRHLGQLVRLGLPVLVVPAGSGNDFANSLGLGRVRDSQLAWRKFCGGAANVRQLDLGVLHAPAENNAAPLGPRHFCCVAGVGLAAEVARRANRLPRWLRAHGGYLLSAAATVFTFSAQPMKIFLGAENSGAAENWAMHSQRPTLLAAFANTPFYGGGMKIAPQAKLDDGQLDVCLVGDVDPFRLFCLFPTVYAGKHLSIREVEYFKAARMRVESEYPLDVYADGEYVCRTPVEVGVQSAALTVITPTGT
jgi:diacylglycerol kinase (ATP)